MVCLGNDGSLFKAGSYFWDLARCGGTVHALSTWLARNVWFMLHHDGSLANLGSYSHGRGS